MIIVNIAILLVLILLNGFFAMSELAVVSSRRARLQAMADEHRRGAASAIALVDDPGRFLSSVQIGISLVGVLAGAFGGSTLAGPLGDYIAGEVPPLTDYAYEISFAVVVGAITYMSLIVGELVPKQLALRDPERVACFAAPVMTIVARVTSPLVSLLDLSTQVVLKLLGRQTAPESAVSDEEIRVLLREATKAGVVEPAEQEMIAGVMRLADRPVSGIMTPRPDIEWLDLNDSPEEIRAQLQATSYSRLPVAEGDIDEVTGVVQAKDLLDRSLRGEPLNVRAAVQHAVAVPETMSALRVMDLLKQAPVHMALVVDEYGSLQGIVTTADVLKVIVGGMSEHGEQPEARAVQRPDGGWLLDGGMGVDEVRELLRLRELQAESGYHTIAGWLLARLDHLPTEGERLEWSGWTFEVVDMDGHRIDKILATPPAERGASVEL